MHSATNNNYDKYPVVWWPTPDAIASTNMARFLTYAGIAETGVEGYNRLLEKSGDKPEWFWQQIVSFFDLRFEQPYTNILDTSEGVPWAKWCVGGTANVVINCLDKYRNTPTWTKPALVWEGEDGRKLEWTYSQLNAEVSRLAEGLRSLGLGVGDVVSLYMPMIPQAAVALLAAAKIGAIIQPLFSGFGADSIVARLSDSGAKAMIIADGTVRRGKTVNMKAVVDEALQSLPNVQSVVVVNNCDVDVNWHNARDNWWSALCAGRDENAATTVVNADDPCMLIHTSGTAGKPKGTLYSHCGFSMKIACDFGLMADYRATDRMMWMSDFGWLVGPVLVTSSLLLGGTIVMAEGAIDYPDAGRFWRLIQDNQVSLLGIAPTIVRSFIHAGGANVESYDLSSIRVSLSTGEPWTMVAWQWMFEKVCKQNAPIVNMSGGTEIGGCIVANTVIHPMKPCAFSGPVLGMGADVVDDNGHSVGPGGEGELVLRQPSPGLTRGLWKDPERYIESYWSKFEGLWWQSDRAAIDTDGYWYVLGRSDDTLKIAGKRTSPGEIETLVVATGNVVEAAAVGVPDPVKGQTILLVCKLMPGVDDSSELETQIADAVVAGLGTPFRPLAVLCVPDLPKTRSMKVMRRLVRAACLGQAPGDLSALVNPETMEQITKAVELRWPTGLNKG